MNDQGIFLMLCHLGELLDRDCAMEGINLVSSRNLGNGHTYMLLLVGRKNNHKDTYQSVIKLFFLRVKSTFK